MTESTTTETLRDTRAVAERGDAKARRNLAIMCENGQDAADVREALRQMERR